MPENSKTLHIFDADRTLVDTDRIFSFLVDSLKRGNYDTNTLIRAEQAAKEQGVSFNPLEILTADVQDIQRCKIRIVQGLLVEIRDPERVRLPGVSELLETLRREGRDFIIHTYGDDDWQTAKLQVCSLDSIPHIITRSVPKALDVARWRGEDSLYRPDIGGQVGAYEHIVVYDDKELNFEGLPEGVTTVHVVQEGMRTLEKIGPKRYRAVGALGMLEYYRTFAK